VLSCQRADIVIVLVVCVEIVSSLGVHAVWRLDAFVCGVEPFDFR
jgi:hypothetical protein